MLASNDFARAQTSLDTRKKITFLVKRLYPYVTELVLVKKSSLQFRYYDSVWDSIEYLDLQSLNLIPQWDTEELSPDK